MGEWGIRNSNFSRGTEVECINSRRITTELSSLITAQQMEYTVDELAIKTIKLDIKNEKRIDTNVTEHLKHTMSEKSNRLLQLTPEKGVSNWLTMLPIAESSFEFSTQNFWGPVSLSYGSKISK